MGRGSSGVKGPAPGDAELYPMGAGKQKVTSLLYINPGAAGVCELSSQGLISIFQMKRTPGNS